MTGGIGVWREAVRKKREEQERFWAELARAVEAMVRQYSQGQHHEAADSAGVALDVEYALTGSCDVTGALCDALGVITDGP